MNIEEKIKQLLIDEGCCLVPEEYDLLIEKIKQLLIDEGWQPPHEITCRGSIELGTGCGKCSSCNEYKQLKFEPKNFWPTKKLFQWWSNKVLNEDEALYLQFYYNVRQLINDLNGGWKWSEDTDVYWVYWVYSLNTWRMVKSVSHEAIGPFKEPLIAEKVCEILNAQSWSKEGPPR